MVVGTFGKKVGTLVTTLAVACAAVSAAPMPAVAQEDEGYQMLSPGTLPTGDYGSENYSRGLGDVSTGETKLYLIKDQYANVGHEGTTVDRGQMSVTIPVGIHFTVLNDDQVVGPADGNVAFKNLMSTSDVHVSGIVVQEANGTHIGKQSDLGSITGNPPHDSLYILMRPDPGHIGNNNKIMLDGTGHADEFGAYVADAPISPAHKHDWNIPAGEVLALDSLKGGCSKGIVFDELDPTSETQIGSVRWTVRLGTRSEADAHDASVTLRFHANGGSVISGQPLQDLVIPILNAEALPTVQKVDVATIGVEGIDVEGLTDVSQILIPDALGKLAWRAVTGNNELIDYDFDRWSLDADGSLPVFSLQDIVDCAELESVTDLAGKTITLYARY